MSGEDGSRRHKFLVVVDESPEVKQALRYASRRARRTGGLVSLLYVIQPADFHHFAGIERIMREEARDQAEHVLHQAADASFTVSGQVCELVIREGKPQDEILKLVGEDPGIRILVLGAGTGKEGPGPLVTALAGQLSGSFQVPITVVPGDMKDDRLDSLT